MRVWKVILAILVIFAAGLIAGGIGYKQFFKPDSNPPPPMPPFLRREYVEHMTQELELTAEQKETISGIVTKSQERVRILFDLISPDLREEMQLTREEIRAQLSPEQRKKFDELPARGSRGHGDRRYQGSRRGRRGPPSGAPELQGEGPPPPPPEPEGGVPPPGSPELEGPPRWGEKPNAPTNSP